MRARLSRWIGATLLGLLLAGCAGPVTRVILLPQEDGSASAVVVRTRDGGGEQVLSQPYQRATAAISASALEIDRTDAATLQAQNKTLFELKPPKPQRFVLYFDSGGTVLTPASRDALAAVVQAALARTGADITVTGHTDTIGANARNDTLSRERAQEIRQMLIERGFPAKRIEAIGRGERELAIQTPDEVAEPHNRRVVVDVR